MKVLSIEEIRKIQIELLEYLHKICCENHLRYYIAFGTVLGAVRHQGYIPWDDDIDVTMPRADYEKLLKIMEQDKHSYIKIAHLDNCKYFLGPFAMLINTSTGMRHEAVREEYTKDMGIYIDIFPLDGRPVSEEAQLKTLKRQRLLKDLNGFLVYSNPGSSTKWKALQKKIYIPLLRLYGQKRICKRMEKESMKWDFEGSKFSGDPWTPESGWILEKSWFGEGELLPFEGRMFYAPKEYLKYLERGYGDYMKLPPVEQRTLTHGYTFFKKDF